MRDYVDYLADHEQHRRAGADRIGRLRGKRQGRAHDALARAAAVANRRYGRRRQQAVAISRPAISPIWLWPI